ncbi:MAG: tetratricopeptide repeat protein [Flammeovirgaceae bacterium]|nr:tetratricopeptide repeat protein [Flammeovirgaceae bacterium]
MSVRVVFILAGILLLACSPERKAMKSFRYGKYESVIDHYKGVIRKEPNNAKAYYYIAESYRLSNRIKEAEPFYAKAGAKVSVLTRLNYITPNRYRPMQNMKKPVMYLKP